MSFGVDNTQGGLSQVLRRLGCSNTLEGLMQALRAAPEGSPDEETLVAGFAQFGEKAVPALAREMMSLDRPGLLARQALLALSQARVALTSVRGDALRLVQETIDAGDGSAWSAERIALGQAVEMLALAEGMDATPENVDLAQRLALMAKRRELDAQAFTLATELTHSIPSLRAVAFLNGLEEIPETPLPERPGLFRLADGQGGVGHGGGLIALQCALLNRVNNEHLHLLKGVGADRFQE